MCKNTENWTKGLSEKEIKIVQQAMIKLHRMIDEYEKAGVLFEKIFNNDVIKYDVLGKNFYTFKAHGEDRAQLRILYRFIRTDEGFDLECHKVMIKRRNDKKYIHDFEKYVMNYE